MTSKKLTKKQKRAQKEIQQKMNMFSRLGDECLSCTTPFDKSNREMVDSWYVVVKKKDVNLYCPTCWGTAQRVIEEYYKENENEN
jgi:hypothetical protein